MINISAPSPLAAAFALAVQALVLSSGSAMALDAAGGPVEGQSPGGNVSEQIGTGFVVGPDAIVTAAHGVDGCSSIAVFPDRSPPLRPTKVGIDRRADLALISVQLPASLPALPIDPNASPATGERVYMLGFPLQPALHRRLQSFYEAIVSGPGGIDGDPQLFRLGMVVLPGMSGAAVLDGEARIVGVVRSHLIETAPNGGPAMGGQSFIVSSAVLADFLHQHGVEPQPPGDANQISTEEVAARALASSVAIICTK